MWERIKGTEKKGKGKDSKGKERRCKEGNWKVKKKRKGGIGRKGQREQKKKGKGFQRKF